MLLHSSLTSSIIYVVIAVHKLFGKTHHVQKVSHERPRRHKHPAGVNLHKEGRGLYLRLSRRRHQHSDLRRIVRLPENSTRPRPPRTGRFACRGCRVPLDGQSRRVHGHVRAGRHESRDRYRHGDARFHPHGCDHWPGAPQSDWHRRLSGSRHHGHLRARSPSTRCS